MLIYLRRNINDILRATSAHQMLHNSNNIARQNLKRNFITFPADKYLLGPPLRTTTIFACGVNRFRYLALPDHETPRETEGIVEKERTKQADIESAARRDGERRFQIILSNYTLTTSSLH